MAILSQSELRQQLINEIKEYAGVADFPRADAHDLAELLNAYDRGNEFVQAAMLSEAAKVLSRYPGLYNNWDELMIKYKRMGFFPNWNIILPDEDDKSDDTDDGEENDIYEFRKDEAVAFEFENVYQFLKYSDVFRNEIGGRKVLWERNDHYEKLYEQGYELCESGRYDESVSILRQALKYNPMGVAAMFEIAENYIMQRDFDKARNTLTELKKLIITKKECARYYRRFGYIAIEENHLKLAYACFLKSKEFEDNQLADHEIRYISSKADIRKNININNVLSLSGIPAAAPLFDDDDEDSEE